ncbi:MAG: hypothetical protein M3R24_37070 [Chloroflexota bacterium]|nr:hypothetical protein [Chloroflexota bacterium]
MRVLTYYAVRYRLDQVEACLIWYTNARDGFFVDEHGRIPAFRDRAQLQAYAQIRGIDVDDDAAVRITDLDLLQRWLLCPENTVSEPAALLSAWNLFLDVAFSVESRAYIEIYERANKSFAKLATAQNTCPRTASSPNTVPHWTPHDKEVVRIALRAGLKLFRAYVRAYCDPG